MPNYNSEKVGLEEKYLNTIKIKYKVPKQL